MTTKDPGALSPSPDHSKEDADVLCVQLDDDCIDLEFNLPIDEDDEEEEEVTCKKDVAQETVEIVDSSADEEVEEKDSASNDSKSWGERWLGSSKVTKILAESKLGNQLRRKIQLSKKKKGTDVQEAAAAGESDPSAVVEDPQRETQQTGDTSTEVGSMEHYKSIVDEAKAMAE